MQGSKRSGRGEAPGRDLPWLGLLVCLAAVTVGAASGPLLRPRLLPEKARALPGGTVAFHLEPAGLATLAWRVVGPGSVSPAGLYAAPYAVSRATPSAHVVATFQDEAEIRLSSAEVDLEPGVFPGAEDCLGEGQTWSTTARGLDYVPVDRLPVATGAVTPDYPAWAQERGLAGSLVVNAVVCRSGQVLDAWVTWPQGVTPQPALEELALAAVRRGTFTPAMDHGSPRAIVVAIPLRFPPR